MDQLLSETIKRADRYLAELPARRISPTAMAVAGLERSDVPLQDQPMDPAAVIAELDDIGSKATVASAGRRYFGFVTGGRPAGSTGRQHAVGCLGSKRGFGDRLAGCIIH